MKKHIRRDEKDGVLPSVRYVTSWILTNIWQKRHVDSYLIRKQLMRTRKYIRLGTPPKLDDTPVGLIIATGAIHGVIYVTRI